MKEIKSAIGWFCFYIMLFLSLAWAWDYVCTNILQHEKRISALEQSARPLFIVDKYSTVQVQGQEVLPDPNRNKNSEPTTLAEEIKLAENDNKGSGRMAQGTRQDGFPPARE